MVASVERRRLALAALGGLLAGICAPIMAGAQAQDFYQGKTIRLIVSYASGGGYDASSRLVAKLMPRYIAGNPTIVVMNMPGAGGLTAANHIANVAEKDGTVFGLFNRYVLLAPIVGNENAKFRGEDLGWIGTTSSYQDDAYVLVVRGGVPHNSIEDLRNPAMPLALGRIAADIPGVLKEALDLKYKIISGYKGSGDLMLAFERGEIDSLATGFRTINAARPEWFKSGMARPLIQFGRLDRFEDLKEIPTARELARTADDLALIELFEIPFLMARPFATPSGVPAERLRILKEAFVAVTRDPEFVTESERQNLEASPKYGDELKALMIKAARTPKAAIERYIKAGGGTQ